MANITAEVIEFFEDIPRAEMGFFGPQQLEHHASLFTESQS
jgi:hypothetical protein